MRRGPNKKPKKPSPEKQFFEALEGKSCVFFLGNGSVQQVGTLEWVDQYSVGVRWEGDRRVQLLYKHVLSGIREA
jgi:sRNA-binding regulator protein Hfq